MVTWTTSAGGYHTDSPNDFYIHLVITCESWGIDEYHVSRYVRWLQGKSSSLSPAAWCRTAGMLRNGISNDVCRNSQKKRSVHTWCIAFLFKFNLNIMRGRSKEVKKLKYKFLNFIFFSILLLVIPPNHHQHIFWRDTTTDRTATAQRRWKNMKIILKNPGESINLHNNDW